jgi:hypothetical protein
MRPCLFLVYAREENVLELVRTAADAGVTEFYISIDAPRTRVIKELQESLKNGLNSFFQEKNLVANYWERSSNLGAGASMIASLDWVFKFEESVVIFDDDLKIEASFFSFMDYGLNLMSENKNILSVCGTNPFENISKGRLSKASYPISWGWATNRDTWQVMRNMIFSSNYSRFITKNLKLEAFWRIGKSRALAGKVEAWDIPLAAQMHNSNYITLIPGNNLVKNIGFDENATHTSRNVWPLNLEISRNSNLNFQRVEVQDLINLNANFEREIFNIRLLSIVSYFSYRFLDLFRFRQPYQSLLSRVEIERSPSK